MFNGTDFFLSLSLYIIIIYIISGAHEARSVQLRATAFDFERFRHLPYMDISSSGESPFVVAAQSCETSATYCMSTRTKRVLLFRARDANSLIVNSYYRSPSEEIARAKGSESEKL